jgi:hypothetical protein
MPTPWETLYTSAQALVAAIASASSATITAAPSNYGDDFRITPGTARYQIQLRALEDFPRATVSYPRAEAVVLLHHYVSSLANEEAFLHVTMSHAADSLLNKQTWIAAAGVFDLEPGEEPELSEGEREGNVITFKFSAVVLMDPA